MEPTLNTPTSVPTPTLRETQTATPKKRTKSAARRGLEATIAQFDELLADATLDKAAKKADLLISKTGALKELLALEATDRDTEAQSTIERLEQQHKTDTSRIDQLEAENTSLQNRPAEVKTLLDPEHAAVREQNATLAALLKFVTDLTTERPQMAIRAIQTLTPDLARQFCDHIGINYREYGQMLRSYRTDADLHEVIEKAQREGPAVIFARAALALRGVKVRDSEDWN